MRNRRSIYPDTKSDKPPACNGAVGHFGVARRFAWMGPVLVLGAAWIVGFANPAYGAEVWRCAYTDTNSLSQVLAEYQPEGRDLLEKLRSGVTKRFQIIQDNAYGLIAILATSEPPKISGPSVSAITVVIEKSTGDFWRTTTIGGQPGTFNQPIHGRCFKP